MIVRFKGLRVHRTRLALIVSVLALAGCGTSPAVADSSAVATSAAPAYSRVSLERRPCYGTCPVYRVSVAGDGVVVFEGLQHVDSIGRFTGRIDDDRAAALSRLFQELDFFTLADKYAYGEPNCPTYATDAPTVVTAVTVGGRSKTVEHDLGCANVPQRLVDLERRIDEIVGTSRWVKR